MQFDLLGGGKRGFVMLTQRVGCCWGVLTRERESPRFSPSRKTRQKWNTVGRDDHGTTYLKTSCEKLGNGAPLPEGGL